MTDLYNISDIYIYISKIPVDCVWISNREILLYFICIASLLSQIDYQVLFL